MPASRIVAIEAAGPKRRARRLVFDDGSEILTAAAIVRALSVNAGEERRVDELTARIADVELDAARERALGLMGYRDRSSADLRSALLGDGYTPATVDSVISRLTDLQLVDDERFAMAYARTRAAGGYGCRRTERELNRMGVEADLSARATREACEDSELERAVAALRGARPATPKERDRLLRRLVSRGFDLSTAFAALDSATECEPEESPDL